MMIEEITEKVNILICIFLLRLNACAYFGISRFSCIFAQIAPNSLDFLTVLSESLI